MIKFDKKKIKTVFLAVLLVVSLMLVVRNVKAEDALIKSLGTFRQGDCVRLVEICDMGCSYVTITSILTPNNNSEIEAGISMNTIDKYSWYYDFCNTTQPGTYTVVDQGDNGQLLDTGIVQFTITKSGASTSANSLAVILSLIAVMVMFCFLGIKLLDSTVPYLGYILLGVGAILAITTLFYGSIFAQDMVVGSIYGVQFSVYLAVLIVCLAIFLLSAVFMLIKYLKELTRQKVMKKMGDGYNPDTKSYEY